MKNIIPLVIAVVFGLAAVWGVHQLIKSNTAEENKKYVMALVTTKEITPKDGEIKDSWITSKRVEIASLPAKAILWRESNRVLGQCVTRTVAKNDYLLKSDISGVDVRLANAVAEGEWAVPVTFANGKLVKFLKPGDEIAIMASSSSSQVISQRDQSAKTQVVAQESVSVLFPCVRILDVGRGDGLRREEGYGGDTIILALSPRQAMTIVAAQRKMDLFPALRRANDVNALRRRDVGVVDDNTFRELRKDLESVVLSDGTQK